MENKGLVVLSGGQDSTTTALFARKECKELHGVTFDYGQKHKIEIKSAIKIAKLLTFKTHEIIKIPNILKSTSPLINKKKKLEKYNFPEVPIFETAAENLEMKRRQPKIGKDFPPQNT